MNKKATKRLRSLFLTSRVMPFDTVPEGLQADWRKMKKLYNHTPKPSRHAILWERVKSND